MFSRDTNLIHVILCKITRRQNQKLLRCRTQLICPIYLAKLIFSFGDNINKLLSCVLQETTIFSPNKSSQHFLQTDTCMSFAYLTLEYYELSYTSVCSNKKLFCTGNLLGECTYDVQPILSL